MHTLDDLKDKIVTTSAKQNTIIRGEHLPVVCLSHTSRKVRGDGPLRAELSLYLSHTHSPVTFLISRAGDRSSGL